MKKCPFCAEQIQDQAIKCCYCREFLGNEKHAQNTGIFAKSGVRHGFLILSAIFFIIGSIFLFPKQHQQQHIVEIDMPKKTAPIQSTPETKPAESSKLEIYLQAYPEYFGLTSGNETGLGKYWYKNNHVYHGKIFYFDTLEQLEEQKLKFTTSSKL
jgi:hypothetical protein